MTDEEKEMKALALGAENKATGNQSVKTEVEIAKTAETVEIEAVIEDVTEEILDLIEETEAIDPPEERVASTRELALTADRLDTCK
jgi:hypothetical protein